jgi:hypothetical protein
MNIPVHISESLKQFFGLNILKSLNAAPDPGWKTSDPGLKYRIRNTACRIGYGYVIRIIKKYSRIRNTDIQKYLSFYL